MSTKEAPTDTVRMTVYSSQSREPHLLISLLKDNGLHIDVTNDSEDISTEILQSLTDDSVQWAAVAQRIEDHVMAGSPSRMQTALSMMHTMFEVLDLNKPNLKNYENIQGFLGEQLVEIADMEPDTQLASVAGYLYGQVMSIIPGATEMLEAAFLTCESILTRSPKGIVLHQWQQRSLSVVLSVELGLQKQLTSSSSLEGHVAGLLRHMREAVTSTNLVARRVGQHALLATMHYYHALELDQHAMGAQILSSVNDVLRQQLVHISLDKMPGKSWPLELIATIITGAPMDFRISLIRDHGLDGIQVWDAIQPIENVANLIPLCTLIPNIAAWKPAWFFSTPCLRRSVIMFMTAAAPGTTDFVQCLEALAFLISAVIHGIESCSQEVGGFALRVLRKPANRAEFKAASKLLTKLLNALGPQVAIIMTKFLEEEDNILIENLELVCDIAILIPFRKTQVMRRLSGFLKTSDPNTFAKVLPALRFFPLSNAQLQTAAQDMVVSAIAVTSASSTVSEALQACCNPWIVTPSSRTRIASKIVELLMTEDEQLINLALSSLQNPEIASGLDQSSCAVLLLALQLPQVHLQITAAKLLAFLSNMPEHATVLGPLIWTHLRQSLNTLSYLRKTNPDKATKEACVLSNLLIALPESLSQKYIDPIKDLIIGSLHTDEWSLRNLVFNSLGNLAQFQVWQGSEQLELSLALLDSALDVRPQAHTDSKHAALMAVARLLSHPREGLDLYEVLLAIHRHFGIFGANSSNQVHAADEKRLLAQILGVIGAIDRNPAITRDAYAAINRELLSFDSRTLRKLDVSSARYVYGASSQVYPFIAVANVLLNALEGLNKIAPERPMVYENIICVCLHQPPNIGDLFPDLPLMLLREAIYCVENDEPTCSGGSALGLYLQLLATSLHLHPPWLTEFWPDAFDVMTKALEVESPPRQMITMALAIVLRQEACSTQVQRLFIPLICQVMEQSQEDDEVTISGLGILSNKKLRPSMRQMLGVWSPVVLAVLGNGENEDVLLQAIRLLACLADAIDLGENEWYFARPLIKLNQGADCSDNIKLLAAATLRKLRKVQIPESMAIKLQFNDVGSLSWDLLEPDIGRLFAEMSQRNRIPTKPLRATWSRGLLAPLGTALPSAWLRNLYQLTMEGSNVPVYATAAKLGPLVHKALFSSTFLACWNQLDADPQLRDDVNQTLQDLMRPNVPQEIRSAILGVIEFLQRGQAIKMPETVFTGAMQCVSQMYAGELDEPVPALALWYAEIKAESDITPEVLQELVTLNIRTGHEDGPTQIDSAWSTSLWLQDDYGLEPNPQWLHQLERWDEALLEQRKLDACRPPTFEGAKNKLICYHALGEYDQGYAVVQDLFDGFTDSERRKTAVFATEAAWHMGEYDAMADFLTYHQAGPSKSMYKAIIDIHNKDYAMAFKRIGKAQRLLYDELHRNSPKDSSLAMESLAKGQFLTELQEVMQYISSPETRHYILHAWRERFKRSSKNPNMWTKRLRIWSMACPNQTKELQHCWLDTAKLFDRTNRPKAARDILELAGVSPSPPGCKADYTRIQLDFSAATRRGDLLAMKQSILDLENHTSLYLEGLGISRQRFESQGLGLQILQVPATCTETSRLALARRYQRWAEWIQILSPDWPMDPAAPVLQYLSLAAKLDTTWFKGGHALSNAAMTLYECRELEGDQQALNAFVVPAIRGLFQALRARESLERQIKATLRLVTLWFRFGADEAVQCEIRHQLSTTPVTGWLQAVPQLIARLGVDNDSLRATLVDLLKRVSFQFPHSMIWPLTAAQIIHKQAAMEIMDHICSLPDGSRLVAQAKMVSKELIRTSTSWLERWKHLIDACLPRKQLFEIAWESVGTFLQADLEALDHPETPAEHAFVKQYGSRLARVQSTLAAYNPSNKDAVVKTVCSQLYEIFMDIETTLATWKHPGFSLDIRQTAPRLLLVKDYILTVPGKYDPGLPLNHQSFISSFETIVDVLPSKQIPRRLKIQGTDEMHAFLLKGSEDARADQLMMQLFNLLNLLLNSNQEAFARCLYVRPYAVIPLGQSSGLTSWVRNTQTMQHVISAHREREKQNKLSNMELASLLGYDPATFDPRHDKPRFDNEAEMDRYEKLPLATKVKRLEAALSHSKQDALKAVLWKQSSSADLWLKRRTAFARTVGVSSMIGYIAGLGDRHGQNILIDMHAFSVIHIDHGDAWETAQHRPRYPEKVPFRLTRMMTNAFEVAGAQGHAVPGSRGNFKKACLVTMGVLRKNRDALLSVLEAFVHDPLLDWLKENPLSANLPPEVTSQSPTTQLGNDPDAKAMHKQVQAIQASLGINRHSQLDIKHRPATLGMTLATLPPILASPTSLGTSNGSRNHGDESFTARIVEGNKMTNERALQVLSVIEKKLTGKVIGGQQDLGVSVTVQDLIEQATSLENLSQGYVLGWCPYM